PMTVGRLALLFIFIPLTAKANRANDCSDKAKLLIMKCTKPGGDPAKGYVFSAIEEGVEECPFGDESKLLGWFLIDPITSTRWKIEIFEQTRTAETKSGYIDGYFKGLLHGPFYDNNRHLNLIKTKGSFWSENADIVLENHNFTITNSAVRQTAYITVNSDTLWNLARSTFTVDNGDGGLQEIPIGEPLPKMLKKKLYECKLHLDTTTVPVDQPLTSPAAESTSTPSTTAADVMSQDGPNLVLVISLGVACFILLLIVISVVIILIFMKKSKKQEPKKEEQLKNWTYDRNSQEKETWQQRFRREFKEGKRNRASVTGSKVELGSLSKGAPVSASADSTIMTSITPSSSNEQPSSSTNAAEGSSKKLETLETSVSIKKTQNSSTKDENSLGSYADCEPSGEDRFLRTDSLGSYKD
ncbi:hypothetical protein PRIPAC_73474, partial [Pristionchus pacificus]